jgi:hypothetical protein
LQATISVATTSLYLEKKDGLFAVGLMARRGECVGYRTNVDLMAKLRSLVNECALVRRVEW